MILSFTGHRPDKLGGYGPSRIRDGVLVEMLKLLRELKPEYAISGMALGVDQWAARCCVHLGIPFVAAIPFGGQELLWPKTSQEAYHRLLKQARSVKVVCGDEIDRVPAMQVRNEWMVDNSDLLLAVWDGSSGGTANCVKYARLMGKPIIQLHPKTLVIKR